MSYQVLSLKWRPQSFDDLVGQDHVTKTLTNAFKMDRVAQGYLLTGPRGVGKTSSARLIAKALNCQTTPGIPCNECNNCQEITDGRNMDVLEIDGASNRGIEEIRNLREGIKYAPMNSPYKIFIIDEVHMLTTQAFNALLRTLEEPPPHGKFILATTDVHKVPATIISRCQRFDFNRISDQVIADRISIILEKENITIDVESLRAVAQKADGSMRDGLSLLDQVIAFAGSNITIDAISEVLGIIPTQLYFNITRAIIEKNGFKALDEAKAVKNSGMPVSEIANGLNQHIRNLMYCKVSGGSELLSVGEDLIQTYMDHANDWEIKDLLRVSDILSTLEDKAKRASQPYLMFEMMLMKLLELDSVLSIEQLLSGNKNVIKPFKQPVKKTPAIPIPKPEVIIPVKQEQKVELQAPKEPKTENVATKLDRVTIDKPDVPDIDLSDKWPEIVEKISLKKASIAAVMEHCFYRSIEGSVLYIELRGMPKFNLKILEQNRTVIEEILASICGKSYRINTSWVDDGNGNGKDSAPGEKPKSTKADSSGDAVSKILELFDGEIIR